MKLVENSTSLNSQKQLGLLKEALEGVRLYLRSFRNTNERKEEVGEQLEWTRKRLTNISLCKLKGR